MAASSHVPKFGNWEGDNVPYTACFDNARKGKAGGGGGKMINPNDPEENPDAFVAFMSPEKQQAHDSYYRNTKKSMSEENFSDNKSNSGKRHLRKRSDLKKNRNESSNSFVPGASPNTPRNGRSNPYDDLSYRSSASVPKFGAWDEMDPKSGEGYTVIFNQVKKEKQIAASKLPNVNQQPTYYTNKPPKSKMCCCLF